MKNTIDSIIFDVDGTLWDITGTVADAWTDYIRSNSRYDTVITPEKLKGLFGKTLPNIAAILFPEDPVERQLELVYGCTDAEHEVLLRTAVPPIYEGLEQALQILSEKYPLFIVSNCQAGYIEVFLKVTGFGRYFRGHLCPGDTGCAKAENIRRIVADNELLHPVYVGDTDGDHNACLESGVPFVYADYGFGQTEKPDYVIHEIMDLTKLF